MSLIQKKKSKQNSSLSLKSTLRKRKPMIRRRTGTNGNLICFFYISEEFMHTAFTVEKNMKMNACSQQDVDHSTFAIIRKSLRKSMKKSFLDPIPISSAHHKSNRKKRPKMKVRSFQKKVRRILRQ